MFEEALACFSTAVRTLYSLTDTTASRQALVHRRNSGVARLWLCSFSCRQISPNSWPSTRTPWKLAMVNMQAMPEPVESSHRRCLRCRERERVVTQEHLLDVACLWHGIPTSTVAWWDFKEHCHTASSKQGRNHRCLQFSFPVGALSNPSCIFLLNSFGVFCVKSAPQHLHHSLHRISSVQNVYAVVLLCPSCRLWDHYDLLCCLP